MTVYPNIPTISTAATPAEIRRAFDSLRAYLAQLQTTVQSISGSGGTVGGGGSGGTSGTGGALPGGGGGSINYSIPPTVTGLAVTGAFNSIFLEWDQPNYSNHAYTEIHRAEVDNLGVAVLIGTTPAAVYADTPPDSSLSVTYYYWARNVSTSGVVGPFNATHGVQGATADDPGYLIELLSERITSGMLFQELSDRIDLIDMPVTGLVPRIAVAEGEILAQASSINTLTTSVSQRARVFAQAAAPTASAAGDLWVETDNSNKLWRWSGSAWVSAQDTAKNRTFYQTAAPTATATGDMWIDSDDNNRLYRWSGSAWVEVTDPRTAANSSAVSALDSRVTTAEGNITANASAITTLDTRLDAAENDIGGQASAISGLDTRVSNAEGAITSQSTSLTALTASVSQRARVFAQADAPTASAAGDLWVETDNGNKLWRWSGSAWTSAQDSNKNKTFFQASAPTAIAAGDLWIDSDDNNRVYRWNGSSWAEVTDTRTAANSSAISALDSRVTTAEGNISAQASSITELDSRLDAAEGNIGGQATAINTLTTSVSQRARVFAQADPPAATAAGDLWIETDNGNKLWRWSGSAWTSAQDTNKNKTFFQTSAPTATAAGDLWFDSDDNNRSYRWNGSSWVETTDPRTAANASAITALDSRLTTAEGNIGGQATSITTLTTNVTTAQATADGKRRVFTVQPVPPYDIGDLWDVGGTPRILNRCISAKAAGGAYAAGDWVTVSNYSADYNTDDAVALGFNPTFSAWSGSNPDGYSKSGPNLTVAKNTSVKRVGEQSASLIVSGTPTQNQNLYCTSSFATKPLPLGTFIAGSIDIYVDDYISGGKPGLRLRLYTNSGLTAYTETDIVADTAVLDTWQRLAFTARVPADKQIYGIRVHLMVSSASGAFGPTYFVGTVLYDNFRFSIFDSTVDGQTLANAAQTAATAYTDAQRVLAETTAAAYADGKVSAEEARAIADAQAKADSAKQAAITASLANAINTTFSSHLDWRFRNTTSGWIVSAAGTLTQQANTLLVANATGNAQFRSPDFAVIGAQQTKVRARIRFVSGTGAWRGRLYWKTPAHGSYTASYYHDIPNTNVSLTDWHIVEWNMTVPTVGGSDWANSTITGIRLEFAATTAGEVWEVDWIAIGEHGFNSVSGQTIADMQAITTASATSISQLQARLDTGDYAAVKAESSASANSIGEIEAKYSIKVDVNGYVAGYGLIATDNNGTPTSEFGVLANKFWVCSPGTTAIVPFMTVNGVNYLNTAVIKNATITSAMIQSLAADKITAGTITAAISLTSPMIYGGQINFGSFNGYAWPAAGLSGAHMSPSGILLGNANALPGQTPQYFQLTQTGVLYAPGLVIANGNATFSGNLYANTVTTNAIIGGAVTDAFAWSFPSAIYGNNNELVVASATLTTIGNTVIIFFDSEWYTAYMAHVTIRIYRGSTLLKQRSTSEGSLGVATYPITFVADTPPAGTYTYKLVLAATVACRIEQTAFSVISIKR